MTQVLTIIQIVVSIILIGLILIQAKGTGFGRSGLASGGTAFTRRGLEKFIFKLTFVIAFIFIGVSILQLVF
ncbi:MAG TPA: preprotein translocase subunit SecG [Alphaproteobacteria bacterium]|jgi:protein translocase SecG subunit|nr:preprotein translocase subunit SecG [Alphaproteobacteria bacterium]